jgi:hypothetical protein
MGGCFTLPRLFDRQLEILIGDQKGGLVINGDFKVTCEIIKDIRKSEPDQATIQITNLNESSRSKIMGEFTTVAIRAGYDGILKPIFSGEIILARSTKQRTDWVTEIICGEGAKAISQSYMSKTYAAGVPLRALLSDAATALGTTIEVVAGGYTSASLPRGKAVDDSARNVLDQLAITHDFNWSIQSNKLVIVPKGSARATQPILLSAKTGLIGSPEFMDDGQHMEETKKKKASKGKKEKGADKKKGLKFKALLMPELNTGNKVVIESPTLKGQLGSHIFNKGAGDERVAGVYILKRVAHSLETQGGEFSTGCECEAA